MSVQELLTEVAGLGIELRADGDLLLYRPVEAVSTDLLSRLRAHKGEIIARLTWPEECLAAEREHGHPSARLYPLLGQAVRTPTGSGWLVAVLPERALVLIGNRSSSFAVFLPGEITPLSTRPSEGLRSTVH